MSPETGGEGGGGETPPVEPTIEQTPVTPEATPSEKAQEAPTTPEADSKLPETEVDSSKIGQVTGLLEQAGLTMKEVAEYAKANDGGVDLETMVALKEKHGDAIASLIADQIKGIHTERTEAANKRDNAVYDQVAEAFKDTTDQSGEDTWKELSTWAKDNVSTEHRADINKLLSQGGLATKLAVQELTTAFKESQGSQEFQEAALLDGDAAAQSNSGGRDISKHEYNTELNALLKSGHQYDSSREVAALNARRTKSISRGIK
tara:strand:+ start:2887 stop:3672 length:786 start_codon:yes stop_codon:yes gene_type:complete